MDVPLWYSDWLAEVGLDMKVEEEMSDEVLPIRDVPVHVQSN